MNINTYRYPPDPILFAVTLPFTIGAGACVGALIGLTWPISIPLIGLNWLSQV
jgi:hypothetical protein